jgi:uncharacterized alkaline shock family protein YloU
VPIAPIPGRSLVTRRAIRDIVRNAVLGVYGVSELRSHSLPGRLLDAAGIGRRGIGLDLDGTLAVDLHLTVASGLPIAEVARQIDASVRYALRHAVGKEPDRISIHIEGLRYEPGQAPPAPGATDAALSSSDLAGSGTDVA